MLAYLYRRRRRMGWTSEEAGMGLQGIDDSWRMKGQP